MSVMTKVNRAYNQVRQELCDVGLLADGEYLDCIELYVSYLWSFGEAGYVFDSGVPGHYKLFGWEEGHIYLPFNVPHKAYKPGNTLADTIRHEYGHAWAWLDRPYIDKPWFKRAFQAAYDDQWELGHRLWKVFSRNNNEFRKSLYFQDYVTAYALTAPYEDFAETFFTFLKYRGSLSRFKSRPGVMKKLIAVRDAVKVKAKSLGLS